MFLGRTIELHTLENTYREDKSTLTVLYGRSNIGKTSLIKEFVKAKKYIYYIAPQASEKEQFAIFKNSITKQIGLDNEITEGLNSYEEVFQSTLQNIGNKSSDEDVTVVVIEEFQNIVKSSKEFMNAVSAVVNSDIESQKLMIICTSSSISWVENGMIAAIGSNAYSISSFVKVKELSFVDMVRYFSKYTVQDCVRVYAVTGGVPGYMSYFDDTRSFKENICKVILSSGSILKNEGSAYVKEELRETALYNTILHAIADGQYKLNELHEQTGFGRDKISVYLKNLIEREIVEKLFSYDTKGNEHTKKGLYRIKANMAEFWFRYVYAYQSELDMMSAEEFYDKYITESIDEFAANAFVKIGTEFIELMESVGKLQINIDKKGRWWGKNGDIDIIACNEDETYVIGKCNWSDDVFPYSMYEELISNVELAGVKSDYVYLFSKGTFDDELVHLSKENPDIILVGIDDL